VGQTIVFCGLPTPLPARDDSFLVAAPLLCGAGNLASSSLSGGPFKVRESLRSLRRRPKAGCSQDRLPHSQVHTD